MLEHTPLTELMSSDIPVPDWWTSSEKQIQTFIDAEVKAGKIETIASSPGGRPVRAVIYGDARTGRQPTANFNSAIGGRNREAFCSRNGHAPVLMVLAGTHGAEVEGMVGALSLIRILESGCDLKGEAREELRVLLDRLRLIIIPCANPDGRARVPYAGFAGLPTEEMTKVNQGTRKDGTLWGWPGCKQMHPMRGDVAFLGGYFDDAGINLMHDEWWNPMSPVTAPLLSLVRREAPDLLLNLHSHAHPPRVLKPSYVPMYIKERVADLARDYTARLEKLEIKSGALPEVVPDGANPDSEAAFNLTSALYHAGAALAVTVEFPHGFNDREIRFGYDQILTSLHTLFAAGADYLSGAS